MVLLPQIGRRCRGTRRMRVAIWTVIIRRNGSITFIFNGEDVTVIEGLIKKQRYLFVVSPFFDFSSVLV